MLLSYNDLVSLVEDGVIEGVKPESINGTSIDVHLGPILMTEAYNDNRLQIVDIAKRTNFHAVKKDISQHPYELAPGEFVLAHTTEVFNLPSNISAEFRLKSSGARSGLNNLFACHCDPGWHGSTLTLELHNVLRFNRIRLTAGMAVGQILMHRVEAVPEDRNYASRGRYNKDSVVSNVKI